MTIKNGQGFFDAAQKGSIFDVRLSPITRIPPSSTPAHMEPIQNPSLLYIYIDR